MAIRIVTLAQDANVLTDTFRMDEAAALIGKRKGRTYDPALAGGFPCPNRRPDVRP
jgi:hypothetical protein